METVSESQRLIQEFMRRDDSIVSMQWGSEIGTVVGIGSVEIFLLRSIKLSLKDTPDGKKARSFPSVHGRIDIKHTFRIPVKKDEVFVYDDLLNRCELNFFDFLNAKRDGSLDRINLLNHPMFDPIHSQPKTCVNFSASVGKQKIVAGIEGVPTNSEDLIYDFLQVFVEHAEQFEELKKLLTEGEHLWIDEGKQSKKYYQVARDLRDELFYALDGTFNDYQVRVLKTFNFRNRLYLALKEWEATSISSFREFINLSIWMLTEIFVGHEDLKRVANESSV